MESQQENTMDNQEKANAIREWVDTQERVTVDFLDEKGLSAMITACTADHVNIAIQTHFPHLKQEISIPLGEVALGEDRTHDTRDPDRPLRHSRLRLVVNLKRQPWI